MVEASGDDERRSQTQHVEQLAGIGQVDRVLTDEDSGLALGHGCGNTASLEHIGHDKSLLHVGLLAVRWGVPDFVHNVTRGTTSR
jgi:hypothetical protein